LEQLISWNIFDHKDYAGEQSACASGEHQLESSLKDIEAGWSDMNFYVLNHRDTKDLYILGGMEEISVLLEDNQVTLQTMMGSRFIMGVREEVEAWAKKLSLLSDIR
jgi:dynein heavy chain